MKKDLEKKCPWLRQTHKEGRLQPTPAGHPQLAIPRANHFLLVLHAFPRIYGNSVTNMISDFLLFSTSLGASKMDNKNIMFMLHLFQSELKKMKKLHISFKKLN
jgi:hypothetical protein